jgi:hypothetical protein
MSKSAKPAELRKTGRPSKYTPEIAAEIATRLSDGEPLRQICRDEHMPHWTAIYEWMARDQDLSLRIARAREAGYDKMAEECLEIANMPMFGEVKTIDGDKLIVRREDMLGHRKLQIETRLKLLAKWNPKKYGDRVTMAGDAENPLEVKADVSIFDAMLKNLEAKRQLGDK